MYRSKNAPALSADLERLVEVMRGPAYAVAVKNAALGTVVGIEQAPELSVVIQLHGEILRKILAETYVQDKVLAKKFGIGERTLQNARCRGEGPPFFKPLGLNTRLVRYNLLAVELWLAANNLAAQGICKQTASSQLEAPDVRRQALLPEDES